MTFNVGGKEHARWLLRLTEQRTRLKVRRWGPRVSARTVRSSVAITHNKW